MEIPTLHLYQGMRQGQPQLGSFKPPVQKAVELAEGFESFGNVFRLHADTVVLNDD